MWLIYERLSATFRAIMDSKVSLLALLFVNHVFSELCHTPELETGRCTPLHSCPDLLEVFSNPLNGSESYLREFICKDEQELHVCCGTFANVTMIADRHAAIPSTNLRVLTAFPYNRHEYESDTPLPVILAKPRNSNVEIPRCFGALINARYVITTAECLKTQTFLISNVQFTLKTNKSFTFAVEEQIPHPFYDPTTGINDLALLRLNETISKDDVTPSHMPVTWSDDYAAPSRPVHTYGGLNAFAAGQWANKTEISTLFVSKEICKELFHNETGNSAVVSDYTVCIEEPTSSCNGYTGVPLFYREALIGISTQRTVCLDNLPDLYTNVVLYKEWLIDNMRPWPIHNEQCTTPDGKTGHCLEVVYCPTYLEDFIATTSDKEEYLRTFSCKEGNIFRDIFVCCPPSSNTSTQNKDVDFPSQFIEAKLCGMQHRDDYFSSSTIVALDEFPWVGLIQSRVDGKYYGRCTGTLINRRYVITSGICALELNNSTAIVRLGHYSWKNEKDCIVENKELGWIDCSETKVFGVEEIVINPFSAESYHFQRLGLLRLNETVAYTDFIRPICLPVQGTPLARVGDFMYLSSWGYKETGPREEVKKKVLTRILTNSECRRKYRKRLLDFVDNFNLCAADEQDNTEFTYALDDGGALMTHNDYVWQIEGLLATPVISYDLPKIYVNVSKYMDWILGNMRPW